MKTDSIISIVTGIVLLSGPAHSAAPANDAFASPLSISGIPVTVAGSNVGATLEPGEPRPLVAEICGAGHASVWYEWTAAADGLVEANTFGSTFNTVLAVWIGTELGGLREIAGDDDAQLGISLQSQLSFRAEAGVDYRIAVYSRDEDSTGDIVLNLSNSVTALSGTITLDDGTTLPSYISVQVYSFNHPRWDLAEWVYAGEGGRFAVGVTAGTYRVEFRDEQFIYSREIYDNAADFDSGTDIIVAEGETVEGIDAMLEKAGVVSGTVTDPDGAPLHDIHVIAYEWNEIERNWNWVNDVYTGEDGGYRLGTGAVESSSYRLEFSHDEYIYATEVYDNAANLDSGTDIVVAGGELVAGIDAVLSPSAAISGIVTGPDGAPLGNIFVEAYEWHETRLYGNWVNGVYTGEDGRYFLRTGAVQGSYRLKFSDDQDIYLTEVYDNAVDLYSGTDIAVAPGAVVSNINAALSRTLAGRADMDRDGLPDEWEILYFSNPTLAAADEDPDGDGQSNLEEYIAGTHPLNVDSRFGIDSLERVTGSGVVLGWDAVEGRIYGIYATPSLRDGFLSQGIKLMHPRNRYTNSVDGAQNHGFYRLEVELPETAAP
jgi:5-hydroxyisourate hydrolase-like protein (transthyretin family)